MRVVDLAQHFLTYFLEVINSPIELIWLEDIRELFPRFQFQQFEIACAPDMLFKI